MIHIATVHYRTAKWVEIQHRYINKYFGEYRLYGAFSKDIDIRFAEHYYFAHFTDIRPHWSKLNFLADIICHDADNRDDIICFLDSDAFPICQIDGYIEAKLAKYQLIAIQRLEDAGALHPHPSFCAMRIQTWLDIEGDWSRGPTGTSHFHTGNPIVDVGGALKAIIEAKGFDWYPLHRTDNKGYDDLMFGIYDSVIYHHWNGSHDIHDVGQLESIQIHKKFLSRLLDRFQKICLSFSTALVNVNEFLRRKYHPVVRRRMDLMEKNTKINNQVYEIILEDEEFFLQLNERIGADGAKFRGDDPC